jgi:hypothetical protein
MLDTELLDCGHPESPREEFTRGYGRTQDGKKHCYECCAAMDRKQMREDGKIVLYLTEGKNGVGELSNWPGTLKLRCGVKKGKHNIAGKRYDVWFSFENSNWHGVQYGDNTTLCRCKRVK